MKRLAILFLLAGCGGNAVEDGARSSSVYGVTCIGGHTYYEVHSNVWPYTNSFVADVDDEGRPVRCEEIKE